MTPPAAAAGSEQPRSRGSAAPGPGAASLEKAPLPLSLQILYGIGEIPITATMGLFGIFVLFFYHAVMGLPGSLAGFGVTAGLVVDAILDPYIGYRSDRSRARLGRRQSFMLFGALTMGPLFILLFSPPQNLGTTSLFVWLLVSSIAFRFCMACYRIPYLSLGAELTSDYDERTRVIAVRSLLGLGGMLAGSALPFLLFFPDGAGGADPKLRYEGYPLMGLFFGGVMTAAGTVAVFGTQSRRTFGTLAGAAREATKFYSGMLLFLRNRQFRTLWLAFMAATLSVVLNFTLAVPFYKWYAGVNQGKTISAIQACFYAGALGGVLMWIWISRWGEKRNWFAGSSLGLAAVLCSATALIGKGHLFGTGNAIPLFAGNVVAGLFASALWVLPFSMMADVVDEDELHSGIRREGIGFGIMNFGEKLAAGSALVLSGVLLDLFIHLKSGSDLQTPEAAARIGLGYGLFPGILLGLCVLLVLAYRLNRRRVHEIQQRLLVLRQEKS